jgi:hypothetical protein
MDYSTDKVLKELTVDNKDNVKEGCSVLLK